MFQKFKQLSSNERGMIIFVIILLFGIFLRWGYVKQSAQRGFDFFLKSDKEAKQ
jgi:hypothetical protein